MRWHSLNTALEVKKGGPRGRSSDVSCPGCGPRLRAEELADGVERELGEDVQAAVQGRVPQANAARLEGAEHDGVAVRTFAALLPRLQQRAGLGRRRGVTGGGVEVGAARGVVVRVTPDEDDLPSPHMDSDGDARGDDARVRVHERIFEVELDLARLGDAPLERLLEEEIADLEAA